MGLRWKKHPRPPGLAAMTMPHSHEYHDGTERYATVQQLARQSPRWFWWARVDGAFFNSSADPAPDLATAKKQAQEWVLAEFAKKVK